jgi:hypothetical protein
VDAVEASPAVGPAGQLKALADDLTARGLDAQIIHDDGLTRISVAHRSVPQLSEDVFAAPAGDGEWWFWWSWGDRITRMTEVETAAFKVAYVLSPAND